MHCTHDCHDPHRASDKPGIKARLTVFSVGLVWQVYFELVTSWASHSPLACPRSHYLNPVRECTPGSQTSPERRRNEIGRSVVKSRLHASKGGETSRMGGCTCLSGCPKSFLLREELLRSLFSSGVA